MSAGFAYEIIVVDIASTVETRNVASEFKEVRLAAFKENIGYTAGVNRGIEASSGETVFIINPDIVPLRGNIEKLADYIVSHPGVGLAGPRLLNFDGSIQNSFFRFYKLMTIVYRRTFLGRLPWAKKEISRFLAADMNAAKPVEVDWIMGSVLMTTRSAIARIGLMDENLFLYMSEVDWAKRFWENGYKVVYFPEAPMYHYHKRESRGRLDFLDILKKEARWHIADAIRYFKKHGF